MSIGQETIGSAAYGGRIKVVDVSPEIQEITVKDEGVARSNLITFKSLRVKNNLYSKADYCSFVYEKYGDRTYVPAGGNEIEIWDGNEKIFGGKIINIKKSIVGKRLVYEVDCKDWVDTLDGELVTETYENKTVNEIISDIKDNYATDFDIGNVSCATTIQKIDFAAMPVSKCLDELAKRVNYSWYVNPDKNIYFFAESDKQSPFDLVDDNGNFITQSLKIEKDFSQIKNRVNVQGSSVANVQVHDDASIALYGEKESIERDNSLTIESEALQKANAILAAYKDPVQKGSFETRIKGLRAGQEININSASRNINQDFIIQSVEFSAWTPFDFEYKVAVMTQPDKDLIDFLQNNLLSPTIETTPTSFGNSRFSCNVEFSIINYHKIAWSAGKMIMSDGTEYDIAAGDYEFTGSQIIYFDPSESEVTFQFSSSFADGMGDDRVAVGYAIPNSNISKGAQVIPVDFHGGMQIWGGENIVAQTVIANNIAFNCLTGNLMAATGIITQSAQIGNALISNAHITGIITIGNTEAQCTDPNADQTSTHTSNDTSKVNGVASSTVATGANRGYNGFNSSYQIIRGFLNTQLNGLSMPYTGVRIDSNGIYGRKSGSYSFWINSSGNAYFSGEIVASSGYIANWTIGSSVLTGQSGSRKIELNSSVPHIKASYNNSNVVQLAVVGSDPRFEAYYSGNVRVRINRYGIYLFNTSGQERGHVVGRYSGGLEIHSNGYASVYFNYGIQLNSGQCIYWGSSSYYLKHDGSNFKISDDLQPSHTGVRLGYTGSLKFYAVHTDRYYSCPLPTVKSAMNVFRKMKKPIVASGKGYHHGKRPYFDVKDAPDEFKATDKDLKEPDIELTRTIGTAVEAIREMIEENDKKDNIINNLISRLSKLEKGGAKNVSRQKCRV